ncbi:MAG: cold shock domain-containing protein [Planctomycetota bacterium]|nr:cold shock domain-containing protein [Planctomycetota bacterium]
MESGTVKKLFSEKGFGFIAYDQKEIFFHHSAIVEGSFDSLSEGSSVEFEVGSSPKGPCAESIRVV